VLYDDRDERGGAKFAAMDLIGVPWQVTLGPKGLAQGMVELKNRRTGNKQEVALANIVERLQS
jgi:prolyl-tRNA synthetase